MLVLLRDCFQCNLLNSCKYVIYLMIIGRNNEPSEQWDVTTQLGSFQCASPLVRGSVITPEWEGRFGRWVTPPPSIPWVNNFKIYEWKFVIVEYKWNFWDVESRHRSIISVIIFVELFKRFGDEMKISITDKLLLIHFKINYPLK